MLPYIPRNDPYAKNISMLEGGLISVDGARKAVEILSQKDTVAHLDLRHNKLGDEGCIVLFEYLRSEAGRRHEVARILLGGNNLGNVALESIGSFLTCYKWLRELYLANNSFVGDSNVIDSFTEALNSSSLIFLSLTSCAGLSDAFAERFFPRLNSPHLSTLALSATRLTRTAVPHIIEYLSSPRSRRLATLKLSGNSLSVRGASRVVGQIKRTNFNITNLDMYGVRTHLGGQDDSSEGTSSDSSAFAIKFEEDLRHTLTRNDLLQRHTHASAFRLLRYSRALLLKPRRNEDEASGTPLHIQHLPTELQLHILSLTVDGLSANQRIRIFQFASDPKTLPEILPNLRRRQSEGIPGPSLREKSIAPFTLSPRDVNRTQWLRTVGCDLYET